MTAIVDDEFHEETAEDTIRRLTADVDHWKELAEKGLEPRMRRMRFENGEFEMEYTGEVAEAIALAMVGHFKASGAVNYLQMNIHDREEPFRRYTVTIQKVGAKSPADKVADAEARVIELEHRLAALEDSGA
jgi:hypothetical protein